MKIGAIVPAAGRGMRMDKALPKQYLPLGGKPLLARTLEVLEKSHLIDEIFLVLDSGLLNYCRKEIIIQYNLKKPMHLIKGGKTRQESVFNGLMSIGEGFGIVLIHDAVRPFIDEHTLSEVIAQASIHKAALVAVPVSDTIKKSDPECFVSGTVPRRNLWAVQTPQAFEPGLLLRAHVKAREDNFSATDDASLVERLGHRVKIVEGSPWNIKITTAEDLVIAEAILREIG